jgi:hypothetical protein
MTERYIPKVDTNAIERNSKDSGDYCAQGFPHFYHPLLGYINQLRTLIASEGYLYQYSRRQPVAWMGYENTLNS